MDNPKHSNDDRNEGGLPDGNPPSFMAHRDGAANKRGEGKRVGTSLASRLENEREQAGLSQAQLAAKANVSRSFISRLEAGERDDLRLSDAAALCRVLGISIDALAGFAPARATRGKAAAKARKLLEAALKALQDA